MGGTPRSTGKYLRILKMESTTTAATFLFFIELYHILGHSVILFGIRSLPYRDLQKVGYYYAIDLLTVALSWCLTQQFTLLVAIQQVQHIYYVLNWNKSHMAKRVAFWSSLDWYVKGGKSRAFEWVGTFYDIVVHCLMAYSLFPFAAVSSTNIMIALSLLIFSAKQFIYSPKTAWASPKDIPNWVEKRCDAKDVDE